MSLVDGRLDVALGIADSKEFGDLLIGVITDS